MIFKKSLSAANIIASPRGYFGIKFFYCLFHIFSIVLANMGEDKTIIETWQ